MKHANIARAQTYQSFARFFLFEPDEKSLRVEFTRLFGMNVFPYASVFLDPEGWLNTETTARVETKYEQGGFAPASDLPIGAPDHFGAELQFVAHLLTNGKDDDANQFIDSEIAPWCGIFLHAVEHNTQEEFYRIAARDARAWLFGEAMMPDSKLLESDKEIVSDEDDLHSIVDYLLSPARSGFFLSKSDITHMARALNLPISFGDRPLMLMSLFRAAGESDQIIALLDSLSAQVRGWMDLHASDGQDYRNYAMIAQAWRKRTQATLDRLATMRALV